jgi:CBS domain containing-hemolysin-like protein
MRRSRSHLTAAMASNGTTTGIATMSDILKQLIGTSRD